MIVLWEEVKSEFVNEGMLLDVLIQDTKMNDWSRLLDYFLSLNDVELESRTESPDECSFEHLGFPIKPGQGLAVTVTIQGIVLNCYSFVEDEIEMDLSPSEIAGMEEAKLIFEVMSGLAKHLAKKVTLTPESIHGNPVFSSDSTGKILYFRNGEEVELVWKNMQ